MVYYAMAFAIVALIVGPVGFGFAGIVAAVAKALFYTFVATLAISLLAPRRQRIQL
jgi:uncharacterized membrane protein YtjA (UPF0391 family)